ncbi:MAG: GTPase [Alphaproteobacteria bacterium]|nr:GTPase [Alphaproteobacteria bacterium]
MRLKSFYGATTTDAMRLVREALGDDAIIVATRDDENGGVRVTAAIDEPMSPPQNQALRQVAETTDSQSIEVIAKALIEHRIPSTLSEKIMATATQYAQDDLLLSIGAALDTHFKFDPIPEDCERRRIILIGPPGAGKTMCAAKLATKATMQKKSIAIISTDTERAGGMAQLDAFARLLKTEMIEIEDSHALHDAISMQKAESFVIIDTAGCNPFNKGEINNLASMIKASGAEPVLVLPADLDSTTSLEMAKEFQLLGARALLPTRIDIARRLGAMLSTAYEANLRLCNFSASSKVTEAPQPLNPVSLARLLLPNKQEQEQQQKATGTHSLRSVQEHIV